MRRQAKNKPLSRSENMSRNRGKNTKPEMIIRRGLHARGLRYSLHSKHLPGRPDLVFTKRKLVLFVHGCFWHGHEGCKNFRIPKTNVEFWRNKILQNKTRDESVARQLVQRGWKVMEVWECQIRGVTQQKLDMFIDELAAEIIGQIPK